MFWYVFVVVLLWLFVFCWCGDFWFVWVAALLFTAHPAGAEAVAWVSGRRTAIATALALGAALAFFCGMGGFLMCVIDFLIY